MFRLGLLSPLDPANHGVLMGRIPELRRALGEALQEPANARLVEQFDPARFNRNATLGENLLFGQPRGDRLSYARLGVDPYVKSILEAEALLLPLVTVGLRMAEGLIEIFSDLPPGSPLFERFSFIDAEDLPDFERIVEQARQGGVTRLPSAAQARLVALGLSYNEQRHRMNVLEPGFEDRVVRVRRSLRTYLPQGYADAITFYDPDVALAGASLRDNMLFGRIAYGVSNAESRVVAILAGVLAAHGLTEAVNRMGLDAEAGSGGKQLQPRQRGAVALARAMIGRPSVLVLDSAFPGYSAGDMQAALAQIRAELTGRTLLVTLNDSAEAEGFDRILTFEGPRLARDSRGEARDEAPLRTAAAV